MNYNFTKPVRLERMQNILQPSSFYSKITKISIDHGDQILIETNTELSVGEQAELNGIIDTYSDFDISIVYDDVLDEVAKFRHVIRKHFGKKNMVRGYNPVQIREFLEDSKPLMDLIDNYALTTAIYEIDTGIIVATTNVPQDDIDEARAMIMQKLSEL
jgi:hypothetical protein